MSTTNVTYDNLVSPAYPSYARSVTLTGVAVEAGQVLGKITASGLYSDCDSTHVDGSKTPVCIALEAADATLADVVIPALFAGVVNADQLEFSGADVLADHVDNLRLTGIYAESFMDP